MFYIIGQIRFYLNCLSLNYREKPRKHSRLLMNFKYLPVSVSYFPFQERVLAVPPTKKLATEEDSILLEADQQRILLVGDFPFSSAITGVLTI